jgi:hypothetical protein
VPGSFTWKNAGALLPVGTSIQIVTFTPNEPNLYRPAEFTVSVIVNKATLMPVFSGDTSPTYDGTAKSLSATTTPTTIVNLTYDGSATAPTSVGIYTVVATVSDPDYQGTATTSLMIGRAAQTITGLAVTDSKVYGDADYTLAVTQGLSTGALSYSSSNTGVATIDASGLVHIVGVGMTTLTVDQAADANYNAATAVTQTLTVNKADQAITGLAVTDSKVYGDADYTLAVTQGLSTGTLGFTSSNTGVATINPITGLVHVVSAGTTTLTVNQAADANYNAASAVTQTLTVSKAAQTITGLAGTDSKVYGDADYTLAVTQGLSTGALSYSSSNTGVATIDASGLVHIVGAGMTTLTVNQAADANYNAAPAVTQTLTVNPATPAGTTYNDWLTVNGGIASDAAFLDYVFGATAPGALPASLKPTVAVTDSNLVLTYYVRQGTVGLTVTAQTSADLATGPSGWVNVTPVDVGVPRDVNGVSVQQKTASVSSSGVKKFLRIKADQL